MPIGRRPAAWRNSAVSTGGPVRVLSADPPVFLTGYPRDRSLGIAGPFGERYGNIPAGFIVYPTWSIEDSEASDVIARNYASHVARFSEHRFAFICNTPIETELLAGKGLPVRTLNKNFLVSDELFRPLPGATNTFDAIYNARLVEAKRPWLAYSVPSVGYVTYVEQGLGNLFEFYKHMGAARRNPGHRLINKMKGLKPGFMSRVQVNAALNSGAIGLVLSEVEGSSYASMEYMMAGSPVVSTKSKGGREAYFDPEYCIICDDNAEAVREAVADLRGRKLWREHVRERTMEKVRPERDRFLALIDDLLETLGGKRRFAGAPWPFADISAVRRAPFVRHLDDFAALRGEGV